MKVEKDNAMDRADVCEQAAKDAKVGTICCGKTNPTNLGLSYFAKDKCLGLKSFSIFQSVWTQTRASKAEEEVEELVTKAQRLEVELDKCKEQLTTRF